MRDGPGEWMLRSAIELRNVTQGPRPTDRPTGIGLRAVHARVDKDPTSVLERATAVMAGVLGIAGTSWDPIAARASLPPWFVATCAPDMSAVETEAWIAWWRTLPPEDQARAERDLPWTVENWLSWIDPDVRQWRWWDASAEGPSSVVVRIEVREWPTAIGALEWLLKAAGATALSG